MVLPLGKRSVLLISTFYHRASRYVQNAYKTHSGYESSNDNAHIEFHYFCQVFFIMHLKGYTTYITPQNPSLAEGQTPHWCRAPRNSRDWGWMNLPVTPMVCDKSRAKCKTTVTPLQTHLSYCSLALGPRYIKGKRKRDRIQKLTYSDLFGWFIVSV